jgi:predicted ATPase
MDLVLPEEARERAVKIVRGLKFKGPVFLISGATGEGTQPLVQSVMQLLDAIAAGREPEVTGTFELPAPKAKAKVVKKKPARKSSVR